jgi:ribosomal-protein-alanine N-acetyltransferase
MSNRGRYKLKSLCLRFFMKTPFPILQSSRLLLRQIVEGDIQAVFQGLSDPDVIRYYGVSYDSLQATQRQMAWFSDLYRQGTGIWWAVCDREKGQFWGAGGLNALSREHQKAEIGFWVLREFWGRGIMTEALPLILEYAFQELKLHRVEGFVETENHACKRVMEKLAFEHEGCMRDCEVKKGQFISLEIYAKVKNASYL